MECWGNECGRNVEFLRMVQVQMSKEDVDD
jgi:hypothetical protein